MPPPLLGHGEQAVHGRAEDIIKLSGISHGTAVKALLEAVNAVHGAVGVAVDGDAQKVVDIAAALQRPADHLPLHQVVGHDVAVFAVRRAEDIVGFPCVLAAHGPGQGHAFIIAQVQPHIFAERVQHFGVIFLGTVGEVVALRRNTGEHDEIVQPLLAADAAFHIVPLGDADIIPGLLAEGGDDLIGGFALDIRQDVVIPPLDRLAFCTALLDLIAQGAEGINDRAVGLFHHGVAFEENPLVLLGQLPDTGEQHLHNPLIQVIADRAAWGIEHGIPQGELFQQHQGSAPDGAVLVPHHQDLVAPVVLDLGPVDRLHKAAIAVGRGKVFVFVIAVRGKNLI